MRVNARRAGRSRPIAGLSGLLFAVAYFGNRHARAWSASSVAPAVYGLSLAIYCTSWTFYGAIGRAATSGIDFTLIYIGPVLLAAAGSWARSSS
jgi:Na+/proline symporter